MVLLTHPVGWWFALAAATALLTTQGTVEALRLGKPATSARLSSSAAHRFPEDLLAQPAYKVVFDTRTVSNQSAQALLSPNHPSHQPVEEGDSHAISASSLSAPDTPQGGLPTSQHFLIHSSPTSAHLCSLTQPFNNTTQSSRLPLSPSNLLTERHRVINSGLALLAPLHGTCLYYTLDWFTYSLCFGESIRQFRAVGNTVGPGRAPTPDPTQDAYVLGRWTKTLQVVGGELHGNQALARSSTVHLKGEVRDGAEGGGGQGEPDDDQVQKIASFLGITREEALSTTLSPTADHRLSDLLDVYDSQSGTELMQIIRFSTSPSSSDLEQRYLSQVWSDGTRCDINDEPRSVEVQYHCEPGLASSRIALIKETTTCNYVLIVETPLTCKEPQLRVGREKSTERARMGEWRCRRVVDGANLAQEEIRGTDARQGYEKDAQDNSAIAREPPYTSQIPSSGRHYAAGVDELGNIVVEGVEDWEAQILGMAQDGAAIGGLRGVAGGDPGQEAALDLGEVLETLFAGRVRGADGQADLLNMDLGELFGVAGEAIELRLGLDDVELLTGRGREETQRAAGRGEQGVAEAAAQGPRHEEDFLGLRADDLQGVIARALESELNKIKAFKERGVTLDEEGKQEGDRQGSHAHTSSAAEQQKRALHARLDRITEALLSGGVRLKRRDGDGGEDGDQGAPASSSPGASPHAEDLDGVEGRTGSRGDRESDDGGKGNVREGETSKREELVQKIAEQRAAKVREAQRKAEATLAERRGHGLGDSGGADDDSGRNSEDVDGKAEKEEAQQGVRSFPFKNTGKESFAERADEFFRRQEEQRAAAAAAKGDVEGRADDQRPSRDRAGRDEL